MERDLARRGKIARKLAKRAWGFSEYSADEIDEISVPARWSARPKSITGVESHTVECIRHFLRVEFILSYSRRF
jgi:hypothetical protein